MQKWNSMIKTFSEYIDRFISEPKENNTPIPGEHHFVSAYLIPRLFRLNGWPPAYINPDGTKGIIGDIVYYVNGSHHYGIEVKFETIRLTKNEFNTWIVGENIAIWPQTFIGIGERGISICSWSNFRKSYIASVRAKDDRWVLQEIENGYGPSKSVDILYDYLNQDWCFDKSKSTNGAIEQEEAFLFSLKKELAANQSLERDRAYCAPFRKNTV